MAGKPARQPPAGPPRPAVLSHNPPGHRPSAPSCIIPRNRRAPPSTAVQPRFTTTPGDRRRSPHFTATPRPVTKWRTNRHGSHPPGRRPLRPLAQSPGTAAPRHPQRCSPASQQPPATAAQPPLHGHPATGHEMAGKPARQPPAGAAVPCALLHKPRGPPPLCALSHNSPEPPPLCALLHNSPEPRAPPSPRITPRGPRDPRAPPPPGNANHAPGSRRCACTTATSVLWWGHQRAPPSPLWETRTTPPARALRMPDRYIRSVAGPPGARRFAAGRGGAGRRKIYYFSSPNTP